ncbi:hypothetical protein BLAT2472_130117 [Burkholderia latens]
MPARIAHSPSCFNDEIRGRYRVGNVSGECRIGPDGSHSGIQVKWLLVRNVGQLNEGGNPRQSVLKGRAPSVAPSF